MKGTHKRLTRILLVVLAILLIPLVLTIRDGGVEGVGWNWSPGDFVAMGTLLFLTGLAIDYALHKFQKPATKVIAVVLIIFALLAIWVELAVDGVSQLLQFLST